MVAKNLARNDARRLAKNFGKAGDSDAEFEDKFDMMWELTWKARGYEKDHKDAMQADVEANLASLRPFVDAADRRRTGIRTRRTFRDGRPHLSTYRVAPRDGSYVVFSDIHITNSNNRQNFFERTNKRLYLDVLTAYYAPRNFGLIENGDVEEMIIFEPDVDTMPNYAKDSWDDIIADRNQRKLYQFIDIVRDHEDYYHTISNHFIKNGAYYRTIGNHDHDMANRNYTVIIRNMLGIEFPLASDIVLLADADGVSHVVCHGHQFDTVCTAEHAARAGESYSQGGAWAYQGPDRTWTLLHDGANYLRPWLAGSRTFENMLVTAKPDIELGELEGVGNILQIPLLYGYETDKLVVPGFWEAIFGKNIAWEYFDNWNPQLAFNDEVETGRRWYKFRHMDEIAIVASLTSEFERGNTPTLVLGHSHEPRLNAGIPGHDDPHSVGIARNYVNSAAAGRFENLVWGVEIVEGVETLVSWHRNRLDNALVRSVWRDDEVDRRRILRVVESQSFARTPPLGPARNVPLAAITHMMLS